MPLIVVNKDSTGASTLYTLTGGTDMFIAQGVKLAVSGGSGNYVINSGASDVRVYVSAGAQLYGANTAIYLGNTTGSNNYIEIAQGAQVSASSYGVALSGNGLELINKGQITGEFYGAGLNLDDATHRGNIVNSGQIVGGFFGLFNWLPTSFGTFNLLNTGLIWGGIAALSSSMQATYHITNRGEMRGVVNVGNNADLIDNVGGKITGQINFYDGNDTLRPGMGAETALGGNGVNLLDFSNSGAVKVYLTASGSNTGAAAGDTYLNFQNITGSVSGSDLLQGDNLGNLLNGQGGNDTLQGLGGTDNLIGGAGNDLLDGGVGADRMDGGAGNDTYVVDTGADMVIEAAGGGFDTVQTWVNLTLGLNIEAGTILSNTNRALTGNTLNNLMNGANGNDTLLGVDGNDTLNGGLGNDRLEGGVGKDLLNGGAGIDRLIGGTGADTLTGGAGADRFVFIARTDKGDVITDFTRGQDKIEIDISAFDPTLATGTLAGRNFVSRADNLAQDGNDRFIFRTTDDTLWFDSNGNRKGGLIMLVDFSTDLALKASDIILI